MSGTPEALEVKKWNKFFSSICFYPVAHPRKMNMNKCCYFFSPKNSNWDDASNFVAAKHNGYGISTEFYDSGLKWWLPNKLLEPLMIMAFSYGQFREACKDEPKLNVVSFLWNGTGPIAFWSRIISLVKHEIRYNFTLECLCRSWCTTHTIILRIPPVDLSLCTNPLVSTTDAAGEHGCTKIIDGQLPDVVSNLNLLGALVLQIPWYFYLAMAFIDVQGNYMCEYKQYTFPWDTKCNLCSWWWTYRPESCVAVVKAYQYSSITSITLLDCFTIVWVIILTWYILGTRYSFCQFLGAGTCVAGLGLVLISDAKSPDVQGK